MELDLSDTLQNVVDGLTADYSEAVVDVYQSSGDTFIRIEPDHIIDVAKALKDDYHYIYLTDILGADRFTSDLRFEVIYNLVCLRHRDRLFLKVWLEEQDPTVESVTQVWDNANWHERQVYDMFGVRFTNHPDMRRIYMPEDFDYHPLRKEFPLLGIPGSIELPSSTPDTE